MILLLQVTETTSDYFKEKVNALVGLLLGGKMRHQRLRLENRAGTREAMHTGTSTAMADMSSFKHFFSISY